MTVVYSARFIHQVRDLPVEVKAKVQKQVRFLLRNPRHPSLPAKKYDPAKGIYQARVDATYRFYYRIEGDTFEMLAVIPHPK